MTSTDLDFSLPRVTISIPTLNRVEYLRLALESALGQTYGNVEVIVSNNASTDSTASYLASCTDTRLHVLHQTTMLSMTENWNACLRAATSEYFLLLSDDDLLEPDAIRQMMSVYNEAEDGLKPGIVYCDGCIIDSAGEVKRHFMPSPKKEDAHSIILHFFQGKRDLWFCGVLMRTVDLHPGFPTSFTVACDAAVWMRAVIRHGYAMFVPGQLVRYRLHASLSSATRHETWRAEYRQLHQLVLAEDRQRGKSDPGFTERLQSALETIDRSLLIDTLKVSFGGSKPRLLLEYGRFLPAFLDSRGAIQMSREIALLLFPRSLSNWVRRLRNRTT